MATARSTGIDLVVELRLTDAERFFEHVLGLDSKEYVLDYYRTIERYIVLSPNDAHRVMAFLSAQPRAGGGRLSRKEYLVHGQVLAPVTVRKRGRASPQLDLYRIRHGATSVLAVRVGQGKSCRYAWSPTRLSFAFHAA